MDFKNLEPFLQQCYNNKDLQVIDYSVTKLLPAGENYGSIMVKIDAKIRTNKTAEAEMLNLIGKTPIRPDKSIVEWPLLFEKERFMYTELFPVYRDLEKEVGIDEKDVIDVIPKLIGYRTSLEDNVAVDDDSVLLMENLKVKGFYMENKRIGMDVHHARKVLISLARYHALGIVMEQRRPLFAKKVAEYAKILGMDNAQLNVAFASTCEVLKTLPCSKKHSAVFEPSFERAKSGETWKDQPIKPWATIIHGDFWTNNMLFHNDDEDNVDDVKILDFQTYAYSSPLKDVCRFLNCSIDRDAQSHLEELLNLYYEDFVKILNRMGCDVSLFTRDSFDREVKRQAINELPVSVLSHHFFCCEIVNKNMSNEEDMESIILNAKPNDAFIERMVWLVEIYERMKWF